MQVAYVTVKGPYSRMPGHYTEFLAWDDWEGWEIIGPPREVYIKHPDAEGKGESGGVCHGVAVPSADVSGGAAAGPAYA